MMKSKFDGCKCKLCGHPIALGAMIEKRQGVWAHVDCPTTAAPTSDKPKSRRSSKAAPPVAKREPFKLTFTPSDYQQAIFDEAKTGKQHIAVIATAGSGKTTTAEVMTNYLDPSLSVWYGCFNVSVKLTALKRNRMSASTLVNNYHAQGLHCITSTMLVTVKQHKTHAMLDAIAKDKSITPMIESNRWVIVRLVELCKSALMLDPTQADIVNLADNHDLALNGDDTFIARIVAQVMRDNTNKQWISTVDFGDMILYPATGKVKAEQRDIVIIDEAQDFDLARIELAIQSCKPGGRIIAIGDPWQSIYACFGADSHAMENIINRLGAKTLPLSISYRCPRLHVEYVRKLTGNTEIQAAPGAIEGTIESVSYDAGLEKMVSGDLVLCRTNAPLVAPAFALIRQGKKAIIRGRDIGKGLITLINKQAKKAACGDDLYKLLTALSDYQVKETAKLTAAKREKAIALLDDQIDTILAIADNVESITGLKASIEKIFTDTDEGTVFSTVHKAKGGEAERVFILQPELMPHPMAVKSKNPESMISELHVQFVAFTRSKNTMYLMSGPSDL